MLDVGTIELYTNLVCSGCENCLLVALEFSSPVFLICPECSSSYGLPAAGISSAQPDVRSVAPPQTGPSFCPPSARCPADVSGEGSPAVFVSVERSGPYHGSVPTGEE